MRTGPRQLALALDHPESFAREDFLSGPSNAAALALIDTWPAWPHRDGHAHRPGRFRQEPPCRDLGGNGGRTADFVPRIGTDDGPARRSPPAPWSWRISSPGALDERALFHLLNLAREEEAFVLLTARSASGDVRDPGPRIPRHGRCRSCAMTPPDDALLRAVLVKLFDDRQLAVDESRDRLCGDCGSNGRSRPRRQWSRASTTRRCASKRPLTRAFAAEILRLPPRLDGAGVPTPYVMQSSPLTTMLALLQQKAFGPWLIEAKLIVVEGEPVAPAGSDHGRVPLSI
mgnify:CR=1 FL=1